MGRKRSTNHDLPPHMTRKGDAYYYVTNDTPRRWLPLGSDKGRALLKWAELERAPLDLTDKTFAVIAERYQRDVLKTKSVRTQDDYRKSIAILQPVFGAMPIDAITPADVREYLDRRGQKAPVRANREKAMLSTLFNHAREWGYTSTPNPCAGVRGFRERGRDRYVEDEEFSAVWEAASAPVRDAMDIAYLTGQRPADVLKMRRDDVRDGFLYVTQNKTGQKLRVKIDGKLEDVLARILASPNARAGATLIQNEKGEPLTYNTLRFGFERAREVAGVHFQFRDLRAKAATDTGSLPQSQALLGHRSRAMTEHYTRKRKGEVVYPVGVKPEKL